MSKRKAEKPASGEYVRLRLADAPWMIALPDHTMPNHAAVEGYVWVLRWDPVTQRAVYDYLPMIALERLAEGANDD